MWENIIDWQAKRRPDHPAIRTEEAVLTYAALARDTAVMTAALEREALPPGVVLIGRAPPALQWLLTFALERLDRTTACESVRVEETAKLVRPAVVITTDESLPDLDGVFMLRLTAEWRRRAFAHAPSPRRSAGRPDDLVRIILSSGTTGDRKQVPIRRSVIDARLGRPLIGAPSFELRTLQTMGMDTTGAFHQPLSTWLNGGVIMIPRQFDEAILREYRPNFLMSVPPSILTHLLPAIEAIYSEAEPLSIGIGGSAAPKRLLEAVGALPGVEATVRYGSTEASTLASGPAELTLRRPGSVGYLHPWTEMQVVDEDGRATPPGRSGLIRFRGAGVVEGYMGEDGAVVPFADGWFYPNDIGHMDRDDVLVIDGRRDDVLNIGGLKLSSVRVEETLMACAGVADAAVAAFPMQSGRWLMHAAIVSPDGYDAEALKRAVLRTHGAEVVLVKVEAIPRNGMGKIVRPAIRQAILGGARDGSGPAAPTPT